MTAKEFLENKNIKEPTYEGVRLVDNKMGAYRIVELLEEYHQAKLKLLGIDDVVRQSEQLVCPECKSTDCKTAIHTDYKECNKCYHYWEAN